MESALNPPIARRTPRIERIHGHERVDDYFWLRDKDAPEVVAYLEAENEYTRRVMDPTLPLQETLYKEMLGRIKETDLSVPYRRGDWLYYSRTEQGLQYQIICRKRAAPDAAEEVLLDLNEIGKTESFVGVGFYTVSDDGHLFAYGLDTTGFRQYTLCVKDLRLGSSLPERFERVTSVGFAGDNRTLFYVVEDPVSKRSYRLYKHRLGDDPAADRLLYEEADERFDLDIERSRSGAYLFVTTASKTSSEVRYLPADRPDAPLALFATRETEHEYYADHGAGLFYIRTNSGGRNFRLCTAPLSDPERSGWSEIVPHREEVMLEGVLAFAEHLVLIEREDGLRRIRITDAAGGSPRTVEFPDPVYALADGPNYEFGSRRFRFSYESPVTPPTIYDYEIPSGKLELLKRTEVLGGFDPSQYEVRRVHASAQDGTKIPISVVSRRGTRPDGRSPLLLYGYGSYGYPLPDTFSSNRLSLLDRGISFALAHIRGGGEMGKRWHEEGRMLSKMNTFTDFIACAEFLKREGWVATDGLIIGGGSAGGLLMGAVVNMRPELFRIVVTHVPFVDVVNTMLDESLPLTVGEFEEWGNPKLEDQYDYMMSYSPYDNLERKSYPTMLVMTSYNDSQVMYWEPAKYVAKLRIAKTDANPLLLKINMEPAGHGGQSGRYNQLREVAFEYAFILRQLGLE